MPAPAAYPHRLDLKRRAASLLLSLGMVGLIVLALMRLGVLPPPPFMPEAEPNTFSLGPDASTAAAPEPVRARGEKAAAPKRADAAEPAPPERERPVPVPTPPAAPATPWPDMLTLDRDEYAASDIGRMRGTGEAREGGGEAGADSVAAYGPGEGPGGQRLYNAEWYREPSDAELAGYLPPGGAPAGSWALIACRTIGNFEVENCRALGESPAGSGLARAMRQAAWQFRVRPPRIGGKPMVGAWVRIRISFGEGE